VEKVHRRGGKRNFVPNTIFDILKTFEDIEIKIGFKCFKESIFRKKNLFEIENTHLNETTKSDLNETKLQRSCKQKRRR